MLLVMLMPRKKRELLNNGEQSSGFTPLLRLKSHLPTRIALCLSNVWPALKFLPLLFHMIKPTLAKQVITRIY